MNVCLVFCRAAHHSHQRQCENLVPHQSLQCLVFVQVLLPYELPDTFASQEYVLYHGLDFAFAFCAAGRGKAVGGLFVFGRGGSLGEGRPRFDLHFVLGCFGQL